MADPPEQPTTTTPDSSGKRKPTFMWQCFLNDFMSHFAELKGTKIMQKYENIILVDSKTLGTDASNFLNKTIDSNAQLLFENLPREVMTNLQPEIKLYKVVYSKETDKKGKSVPLPINNFGDPAKYNYYGRSPGHLAATIKEFSWDYLGTNPAEVDYYINCRLKLWFSSKDALFHKYKIGGTKVSFADLISRPQKYTSGGEDGHRIFNHEYFRIRVDVQYPEPTEMFIVEACKELRINRAKLLAAIRGAKISFFLNILKHDFNLLSDVPSQPFEVEILYNGAVESSLWDPTINILRPDPNQKKVQALNNSQASQLLKAATEQAKQDGILKILQQKSLMDFLPDIETNNENLQKAIQQQGPEILFQEGYKIEGYGEVKNLYDDYSWHGRTTKHKANAPTGGWSAARQEQYQSLLGAKGYNQQREKLIINYYKARMAVRREEANLGVAAPDLKSEAYTRIIRELYGLSPEETRAGSLSRLAAVVGGRIGMAKNRIMTHNLPSDLVLQWWTRQGQSTPQGVTDSQYKELRRQSEEEQGDVRENAIKRIKELRKTQTTLDSQLIKSLGGKLGETAEELSGETSPEAFKAAQDSGKIAEYNDLKAKEGNNTLGEADKKRLKELEKQYESASGRKGSIDPKKGPTFGPGVFNLHWFYFGDLLDVAVDIIRDLFGRGGANLDFWGASTNPTGRTRLILGDVNYFDVREGKRKSISLAKVPISMDLFNEWWFDLVVKPQKEKLSFRQFLQSAMSGLLQEAFTAQCALTLDRVNNIRVNLDYFTIRPGSPKPVSIRKRNKQFDESWYATIGGVDAVAKQIATQEAEEVGYPAAPEFVATIRSTIRVDKEQEIFFIYCTSNVPTFFSQGKIRSSTKAKARDIANGILYLEVGVDGTPVKDISFNKVDIPFYNESRGEQAGFKDNTLELSNVYNCNFKTIGNTSLRPGRHIYIRLPHFGNPSRDSEARILGIGGYYMINKASNTIIAQGRRVDWETEAEAFWQAFGAPMQEAPIQKAEEEEIPPSTGGPPVVESRSLPTPGEVLLQDPEVLRHTLDELASQPDVPGSTRTAGEGNVALRKLKAQNAREKAAAKKKRDAQTSRVLPGR